MVVPIGVDLDNTIVSHDNVLFRVALEQKLIGPTNPSGKKAIRDAVRKLPDGEIKWQKLQAEIYGPRMKAADLIEGVDEFFYRCRLKSIPVYIVSHKTEFANCDTIGTNLRMTAMDWLYENRFFEPEGMGLNRQKVFFESTRQKKIERIKTLGCMLFIDDLEETFLEESLPDGISKILFDRHGLHSPCPGVLICNSWSEIVEIIFECAV